MGTSHGKKTVGILNGTDLSGYSNNSTVEIEADDHDTTVYGKDWHVFDGGLLAGNFTVSGFYDTSQTTGPKAVIQPIVGTKVTFIHRPEGTGVGLPQDTATVLVKKYSQTSPVADMVTFSVDLKGSDALVSSFN
jgi:hypothetical protein